MVADTAELNAAERCVSRATKFRERVESNCGLVDVQDDGFPNCSQICVGEEKSFQAQWRLSGRFMPLAMAFEITDQRTRLTGLE